MTLQQTIDLAVEHFNAGRLAEAEALYRQVLTREPNHAQAMHLLGALAHHIGRYDDALQLITRSIALQPRAGEFYVNLGVVLESLNRIPDAVAAYQQAVNLRSDVPEAHFNLGSALVRIKRYAEAEACFRKAIQLRPNYAKALNNLGSIFFDRGDNAQAIEYYRQALSFAPDYHEAHNNLGNALFETGQIDQAFSCFQAAIRYRPDYDEAYNNLGRMFLEQDRLNEGMECFRRAIALRQDNAQACTNMATVMYRTCRLDEAIEFGRRAVRSSPDFAASHWNLGLSLLCRGDFAEGWKEYAWRTQVKEMRGSCRQYPQPLWDGGDLGGKTILLHAEQGFGDTLQFIRYLPQVQARGGKVILDCRKELSRLMRNCYEVEQWIEGQPAPHFDLHCPMLSLPMALGTTLQSIPAEVPYLFAEAAQSQRWKDRLAKYPGLKIGLAWAGRPEHGNDRNRSIPLSILAPLIASSGGRATFFSLQKGPPAQQIKSLPGGVEMVDWTQELNDFADTAALLSNLDLLISVDTAIVHLAGAMNKPAWVLLPFAPDWRWMLNRPDSPWYPSLRLFRQPKIGDWSAPLAQISESLQALTRGNG